MHREAMRDYEPEPRERPTRDEIDTTAEERAQARAIDAENRRTAMSEPEHQRLVDLGRAAVKAGDGDHHAAGGDAPTGYADALANIMRAAGSDGVEFERALARARDNLATTEDS